MIENELDKLLCKFADTKDINYLEQMKVIIDGIISKELSKNIILVDNTI